jgi:hypothetical protein
MAQVISHHTLIEHQRKKYSIEKAEELCDYAAGGGHLDVLKWARKQNFPWYET